MIRVLLIGNGAREHVIAETIMRSRHEPELYAFMKANNPGIAKLSKDVRIANLNDFSSLAEFIDIIKPEFAIIGPEAPLADGVVDFLEKNNVKCVGPSKELAKLETSKKFTRDLIAKHKIPGNPKFRTFTSLKGIKEYIENELGGQFVIKADGLRSGKGVKVLGDHLANIEEGIAYCKECIEHDGKVIIEQKLEGEEFSLQCLTDGKTVAATPPVQDHKRAYEGDKGPNTGGMGSYSDANHLLPFLKEKDVQEALNITQLLCNAIHKETGKVYKGVMYGGFMITKDGVRVIEYNARFGDPEAMNVLPLLKTDFIEVCRAIIHGTLNKISPEFEKSATVCKYAVPKGYPETPADDERISIENVSNNAKVYYASVDKREDGLYMGTSRAIAFVGIGESLDEAEQIAQRAISSVKGNVFYRRDIGTKELIEKRVQHIMEIRSR